MPGYTPPKKSADVTPQKPTGGTSIGGDHFSDPISSMTNIAYHPNTDGMSAYGNAAYQDLVYRPGDEGGGRSERSSAPGGGGFFGGLLSGIGGLFGGVGSLLGGRRPSFQRNAQPPSPVGPASPPQTMWA